MEEGNTGAQERTDKLTRKDLGRGLIFLGGVILLLTALFLILSLMQPDSFYLFSQPLHLAFDTAAGASLILGGLILVRPNPKPSE